MRKKHKEGLKNLAKLYGASKKYPSIGAKELLNIDLAYYQEDILERLWSHKRPMLLCSRRTGKTFTTAAFIALKALLFENMKVGIVAPVFRQAQTVFKEVEKIYQRSPLFQAEVIDEPKHRTTGWIIELENGSSIEAVPLNKNIRSKGFNIIFIDEYGFQSHKSMNDMVEKILVPMIFTKREGIEKDPNDIGNQLIIASTATFKWNDFYKEYQHYNEKIAEGNPAYDVITYDFIDGLKGGKFENQLVIDEYYKADPLTRKMEYLNQFPDDTGGFITYQLLSEKAIDTREIVDEENDVYVEPKTKVEFEQEYDEDGIPTHKYIMAIDDADQGKDNFAVAIIKMDDNVKRLVRVEAMNNAFISDKVELIRKYLKRFNVVQIVADQRHKNIKDGLAEPYNYNDGSKGEIIVDEDDKDQLAYVRKKYGNDADIKKMLKIHNFSNKTNEKRARHFLSEIQKGRFKIPAEPYDGYISRKHEKAYNEIKQTIFEITSIKIIPYDNVVKYKPESSSQTKDRWTVCELGCWMADEFIKGQYQRNKDDDIVIGKWSN